jgi:transposase InsO family protein
MPWKKVEAVPVSQLRTAFAHSVRSLHRPVAQVCRDFGISRQTGYVWLRRFDAQPGAELADRSRRPRLSPGKTVAGIEDAVLAVRDEHRWGARKIRAVLLKRGLDVPSVRTVHAILDRRGRLEPFDKPDPAPLRFERSTPNELWQIDFLQDLEVARARFHQLTILDDHSRYLLGMPLVEDRTMLTAWGVLWGLFGEVGLPESILSDNNFGSNHQTPRTISWLESRLLRLGISPIHGRPYHPQTQGKVERLHRTIREEFFVSARRDSVDHYRTDAGRWTTVYNSLRPHESLNDEPPLSRWLPSNRPRPRTLPAIVYPDDAVLRRVCPRGLIRWHKSRILAGNGLAGETVRVEDRGHEINVYLGTALARSIPTAHLKPDAIL